MKEQRRPHTLLKLLMTTFCAWEWLILLRRFVSEFIYISYFSYANHTSCAAFRRASPSTLLKTNYPGKLSSSLPGAFPRPLCERKEEAHRLRWALFTQPSSTLQIPKCLSGLFFHIASGTVIRWSLMLNKVANNS